MLNEQTPACGPARDALIAGGAFAVWDGLPPANRHTGTFQIRLRHTSGHASTDDILKHSGEELLPTGRIDAVDMSSVFTIFLNSSATAVVACAGGRRPTTPQT